MITTLPGCKHKFHFSCISNWFTTRPTCPMCRGLTKKRMLEHYHGDFSKPNSKNTGNSMISLAHLANPNNGINSVRSINSRGRRRVRGFVDNSQNKITDHYITFLINIVL